MKLALFAMTALLAPIAAQAQPPGLYDQAVSARRAGDNDRARILLEQLVSGDPRNADAQVQLGYALLALGRLDEAEQAFRRTLEIAPDYADARIGLARIAQRRGAWSEALAALDPVDPSNPEVTALQAQLRSESENEARTRLDVDLSYSHVEGGRPDWREGSVQLRHQVTPATAVGAGVELSHRFGLTDVYGEFRLDQHLSKAATIYASLGGTPDSDFRPEWQIGAGGSLRVAAGANPSVLTIEARQSHFRSGDIQTLNPGIEQYLAGGRAWLTARWINIFDEDGSYETGWLARADLQASDRLRVFLGAADAPDTSEGVVTETFSLFSGIAFDLSRRQTLRLSVAHEDREGGADRLQLGVGVGVRF